MRVQFDLRPAAMLERERKQTSTNLTRVVAILLLMGFIVASSACVAFMMLQIWELQDTIEMLQFDVAGRDAARTALEAEVRRLRAREQTFVETLRIMQDDLPTLEVLYALETYMDFGMGLTSLRFSRGPVVAGTSAILVALEATAVNEEQITTFLNDLQNSQVFSVVPMPQTTRDVATGRVRFILNLTVLPIGQIDLTASR